MILHHLYMIIFIYYIYPQHTEQIMVSQNIKQVISKIGNIISLKITLYIYIVLLVMILVIQLHQTMNSLVQKSEPQKDFILQEIINILSEKPLEYQLKQKNDHIYSNFTRQAFFKLRTKSDLDNQVVKAAIEYINNFQSQHQKKGTYQEQLQNLQQMITINNMKQLIQSKDNIKEQIIKMRQKPPTLKKIIKKLTQQQLQDIYFAYRVYRNNDNQIYLSSQKYNFYQKYGILNNTQELKTSFCVMMTTTYQSNDNQASPYEYLKTLSSIQKQEYKNYRVVLTLKNVTDDFHKQRIKMYIRSYFPLLFSKIILIFKETDSQQTQSQRNSLISQHCTDFQYIFLLPQAPNQLIGNHAFQLYHSIISNSQQPPIVYGSHLQISRSRGSFIQIQLDEIKFDNTYDQKIIETNADNIFIGCPYPIAFEKQQYKYLMVGYDKKQESVDSEQISDLKLLYEMLSIYEGRIKLNNEYILMTKEGMHHYQESFINNQFGFSIQEWLRRINSKYNKT